MALSCAWCQRLGVASSLCMYQQVLRPYRARDVVNGGYCTNTSSAPCSTCARSAAPSSSHLVCAKNCRATSSLLLKNSDSSASVVRMSLDADSAIRTRPCICTSASEICCCCSAAMSALPFLKYLHTAFEAVQGNQMRGKNHIHAGRAKCKGGVDRTAVVCSRSAHSFVAQYGVRQCLQFRHRQ